MSNDNIDNDIPTIILDEEDRDAFQRTRSKGKVKPAKEPKTEKASSGVSGTAIFALLLALAAGGACYWLYMLNQSVSQQLGAAENRIEELERRLSATGEEMDQSAVALQVKVKELTEKSEELWRQMDKLWASAWRRNQADIKTLQENINKVSQSVETTVSKALSGLENDIALNNTNLAVLQEQLTNQTAIHDQLKQELAALEKQDSAFKRQFGDIQAKLIASDQINSAISRRIAELEKWRDQRPTTASSVVTTDLPKNKGAPE